MGLLDEVEKHRSDIKTNSYTITWRELLGQYKDGDLIINPDYQRLFRWDLDQQTQYLESLLPGAPSFAFFAKGGIPRTLPFWASVQPSLRDGA